MLQSMWYVEKAIELSKAEESRINESIHQCKEILRSMRTPQKNVPKEEVSATSSSEPDPEVLAEERLEMELLQQVLEKALRVRGVSGADGGFRTARRDGKGMTENRRTAGDDNPSFKPGSNSRTGRKETVKSAGPVGSRGGRGQTRLPATTCRTGVAGSSAQSRARVPVRRAGTGKPALAQPAQKSLLSTEAPSTSRRLAVESESGTRVEGVETGDTAASLEGNGTPSPLLSAWRVQRVRQNRLWDEVLREVAKPVAERTRFSERLLGTFPATQPSGSLADTKAEVDRLTQLCGGMTQCYQAEMQAARAGNQPGRMESLLMLAGLEKVVSDLRRRAEQLRVESDAWVQRLPPVGCLVRRRGSWGGSAGLALCPSLDYTSVAELKELERLRLRVLLLQQEIHLHQVFSEGLSPRLLSTSGGPGAGVLRGLYSLLGEGGRQFPALVLDTDPE